MSGPPVVAGRPRGVDGGCRLELRRLVGVHLAAETMTALPPSPSLSTGGRRNIARIATAVILVAAAFALRGRYFGIPHLHVDEQFYLLVGDRDLYQGAIHYYDLRVNTQGVRIERHE